MKNINGLGSWLWQRIAALYLSLFLIYFIISFICLAQFNYADWLLWHTQPVNSVLIFIGFFMLTVHAWIGIKDVIMDYVHPVVARALVMMLFAFMLMSCLVWASRILLVAILK